ncbi:hypothetical protein TeGR_g9783 [Tetraparma gracilis]|uniref:Uncharacterized protein n=1 Tax=Tetraparma gracilis TaxID=2962635 RepID=A0ABQ6N3S4_9STRA|nr:hypothetical protein TeGR_g9783 [Tetraparma gracilis]
MYSIWSDWSADKCIDGDMGNICHSAGTGAEEYLRVDYSGLLAGLASIVVTNRPGQPQRIVGARIHVNLGQPSSNTAAAASALWSDDFTSASSSFTFSPPPTLTCPA